MNKLIGESAIKELTKQSLISGCETDDEYNSLIDAWKNDRESIELSKGENILSCSPYWDDWAILVLDEDAVAYSSGFCGGLTSDSYVIIITTSGKIYIIGDEPAEYDDFDEIKKKYSDREYKKILSTIETNIKKYNVVHVLLHM